MSSISMVVFGTVWIMFVRVWEALGYLSSARVLAAVRLREEVHRRLFMYVYHRPKHYRLVPVHV